MDAALKINSPPKKKLLKRKKKKKKKQIKLIGQMFIDPGKIKRVEVNNENMKYYNNIYEQMRSEESKRKRELKLLKLQKM